METRCGSCNKLFRVSNDKITGTGIKFPCTRCGEYVKITKEEFEHYTLSLTAVSVLDMFEPKPKPVKTPPVPETAEPVASETIPAIPEEHPFDLSEQSTAQEMQEESPPPFAEPEHFSFSPPAAEPPAVFEPQPQPVNEPEIKTAPPAGSQSETTPESKPAAAREVKEAPPVEPKPEPMSVPAPVVKPTATPAPKTAPLFEKQPRPEPARPAAQAAAPSARPVQPGIQKKEQARPVVQQKPERAEKTPLSASKPAHSSRMIMVLAAALIIGALAVYGVFVYLQSSSQQGKGSGHELTSVKGIQILNPAGSVEQNGDLLVTGIIENTTDTEIAAWYVVVEVYDSQNALLSKLRLMNGKQIYNRRDFDILAKRGMNIQDLKAKYLQEKIVVLPPKGSVKLELRYLQPPAGIASFNALVLPFDPEKQYKEIAEDMK